MSEFTQLIANEPIITPPIPELVWDKRWIDTLTITSPAINKISLYCKMVPCRDNIETQDKELKPNLVQSDVNVITVDNIWEILGTNPKFGMAMELMFQAINDYGKTVGVIKPDVVVEPDPVIPEEPIVTP